MTVQKSLNLERALTERTRVVDQAMHALAKEFTVLIADFWRVAGTGAQIKHL